MSQILFVPPDKKDGGYLPSLYYNLKIVGALGSKVSLLGVDKSVYLLSKRNLLTPESVSPIDS